MDAQINDLIRDVRNDRERVKKSVHAVLQTYGLDAKQVSITREKLDPSQILVAAVEECSLEDARKIMGQKYRDSLPAPVTVLRHGNKNVLFMGSNRSLVFVLKGEKPDCIVVKLPDNMKEPLIFSEAKQTLKQVMERQCR